ncbi:MAG: spore cortex biosynthesis protein YabQ [Ruminococcus sp.]|nr:spore cortex biosynthesis protein YabQ [Ruminococcus sp.]
MLFLWSCLIGFPLGILFDVFRTIRTFIPHGKFIIAIEDIFFMIIWAIQLICFTSLFARGEFRIFYAIGNFSGFLLYLCIIGNSIIKLQRNIAEKIKHILKKIFSPVTNIIVKKFGNTKENFSKHKQKQKLFQKKLYFPFIIITKMLYNKKNELQKQGVKKSNEIHEKKAIHRKQKSIHGSRKS